VREIKPSKNVSLRANNIFGALGGFFKENMHYTFLIRAEK